MLLDQLKMEGGVDCDVTAVGKRNWKNLAMNRQIWQKLQRKAIAQKGLFYQHC